MSDSLTIYRLLKKDPRYPIEAYQFVREGLTYATEVLALGQKSASDIQKGLAQQEALEQSSSDFQKEIDLIAGIAAAEPADEEEPSFDMAELDTPEESEESPSADIEGRHLTGQELCEALRQYALQQYGYMAFSVLSQWGISATRDFGSIVYNLIEIGLMRKSAEDRQEHFNDLYDFQEVFVENFQFESN